MVACLASCGVTSPKPTQKFTSTVFLDYRPYTDAGFFISPDPYPGDFRSLGELHLDIHPAQVPAKAATVEDAKGRFEDGVYKQSTGWSYLVAYPIPASELMDEFVAKAKELGGDGVANFKCLVVYHPLDQTLLDHYELSGLIIDRL